MNSARYITVFLMLLLMPVLLFGAITATYYAEPSLYLQVQPGPYTSDTVIGAKLGFLEVTTDGEEIYSPAWGSTSENILPTLVYGDMRWYDQPSGPFIPLSSHPFHIMSVAYRHGYPGQPTITKVDHPYSPIIDNGPIQVKVSPFRVELYLVNTDSTNRNIKVKSQWPDRPAIHFKEGFVYTFDLLFDPAYSFVVANQKGTKVNEMMNLLGEPNSNGSYVSVGGNTGSNSIPIAPGLNPNTPGMPYGPPQTVIFSVALSDLSTTFDLAEAVGSNRKVVNTMTIIVYNGVVGANYSQEVVFTDTSSGFDDFRLLHEEGGFVTIPFNLFFGGTQVTKGEPIDWDTLQSGSDNIKTIQIGGIDQNAIDSLASGTYSDTISVEIRNP